MIDQLGSTPKIVAADVGCGAGRYDQLLFRFLGEKLFLLCADVNAEMLGELDTYLTDLGEVRQICESPPSLRGFRRQSLYPTELRGQVVVL